MAYMLSPTFVHGASSAMVPPAQQPSGIRRVASTSLITSMAPSTTEGASLSTSAYQPSILLVPQRATVVPGVPVGAQTTVQTIRAQPGIAGQINIVDQTRYPAPRASSVGAIIRGAHSPRIEVLSSGSHAAVSPRSQGAQQCFHSALIGNSGSGPSQRADSAGACVSGYTTPVSSAPPHSSRGQCGTRPGSVACPVSYNEALRSFETSMRNVVVPPNVSTLPDERRMFERAASADAVKQSSSVYSQSMTEEDTNTDSQNASSLGAGPLPGFVYSGGGVRPLVKSPSRKEIVDSLRRQALQQKGGKQTESRGGYLADERERNEESLRMRKVMLKKAAAKGEVSVDSARMFAPCLDTTSTTSRSESIETSPRRKKDMRCSNLYEDAARRWRRQQQIKEHVEQEKLRSAQAEHEKYVSSMRERQRAFNLRDPRTQQERTDARYRRQEMRILDYHLERAEQLKDEHAECTFRPAINGAKDKERKMSMSRPSSVGATLSSGSGSLKRYCNALPSKKEPMQAYSVAPHQLLLQRQLALVQKLDELEADIRTHGALWRSQTKLQSGSPRDQLPSVYEDCEASPDQLAAEERLYRRQLGIVHALERIDVQVLGLRQYEMRLLLSKGYQLDLAEKTRRTLRVPRILQCRRESPRTEMSDLQDAFDEDTMWIDGLEAQDDTMLPTGPDCMNEGAANELAADHEVHDLDGGPEACDLIINPRVPHAQRGFESDSIESAILLPGLEDNEDKAQNWYPSSPGERQMHSFKFATREGHATVPTCPVMSPQEVDAYKEEQYVVEAQQSVYPRSCGSGTDARECLPTVANEFLYHAI